MSKLVEYRKALAYRLTEPVARLLSRTPITPNTITWLGFLLTVGAAVFIITRHFFIAGLVVLAAGFFDILDGALARHVNCSSRFGAILDSTLDRLSEAVLLISILVVYASEQSMVGILLVNVALIGSLLVSYTRARAEALSLECQVGILTRAERIIILVLGLLLNNIDNALIIALAIISAFSFFTTGQRIFHVWKNTRNS